MSLITVKNVSYKYESKLAVDDVSFTLESQDYLCILGVNGSGKSTLVKNILGLVKPTKGSIEFNGVKQTEIGYLPQQTIVQRDFPASVYEVVISGCLNRNGFLPFHTKANRERANENLRRLGIEHLRNRSYKELSGGEQQRTLLARALCATDKILLLDEPVAGLDPIATNEMYALLDNLNKEHGITIIMISHDIQSAVMCGNKILHMATSPLFFGSVDEYLKTDISEKMLRNFKKETSQEEFAG
jgi:zinc transport system ATP-binding protein